MGDEQAKLEQEKRLRAKWDACSEAAKKRTIWINRIPVKSKEEFLKLADEEFEGDWGMTLKWLIDFRKGLLSNPNEQLAGRIDILADKITAIENSIKPEQEEKPKGPKGADGKEKKITNR